MRRTLTRSETAFALGITGVTLDKYRKEKKIFATRNGLNGWWRYPISEVERVSKCQDGVLKTQTLGIDSPETDDFPPMPVGIVEEE